MAQMQMNLKVTQSKRDDGKIQLNVTVPESLIEQARIGATMNLAQQNRIDLSETAQAGSEAATQAVIEKVGEPQYLAFLNHYTMHALSCFAVSQEKLGIIMDPEVSSNEQVTPGKDFHFIAVVTPKPEYELSSYEPVSAKIPKVEVTDAEIEQQLANLAESHATQMDDKDATVKELSELAFSIETSDHEGPLNALTSDRRIYRLGEGYLPDEFDKQLIGMKVGESKTFDFGLPNPDPTEAAVEAAPTLNVTTTVKILQVFKQVIPSITDAWVEAKIPEAKNLEGLRKMVREQGMEYKSREIQSYKQASAASELAKRLEGTIDDELYEYTSRELMANFQSQLQQNGMTVQDFIKQQGMDEQSFSMQIMLQTRETLRQGLSLDALARHLKLTIDEEDIEETLEAIAPGQKEMARQQFEGSGRRYVLEEAAMRSKANKWLVDTATFETIG